MNFSLVICNSISHIDKIHQYAWVLSELSLLLVCVATLHQYHQYQFLITVTLQVLISESPHTWFFLKIMLAKGVLGGPVG